MQEAQQESVQAVLRACAEDRAVFVNEYANVAEPGDYKSADDGFMKVSVNDIDAVLAAESYNGEKLAWVVIAVVELEDVGFYGDFDGFGPQWIDKGFDLFGIGVFNNLPDAFLCAAASQIAYDMEDSYGHLVSLKWVGHVGTTGSGRSVR